MYYLPFTFHHQCLKYYMITDLKFEVTSLRTIKKEKRVVQTYSALRIHRLVRHGAKAYNTASH